MGLLAAIAIPAYNNYRTDAQAGVIQATFANIERAFPACLTTSPFATCATTSINGTLNPSGMSRIYSNIDGTGQNVCYGIELGGNIDGTGNNPSTSPDFSGCVGFKNDNVGIQRNMSQGFPTGTQCGSITPAVFCTAGDGSSTVGTIPSAGTVDAATTCGMFPGCMAGAMTGTCAVTASVHMATAVDPCAGGRTTGPEVAICMGDGTCGF